MRELMQKDLVEFAKELEHVNEDVKKELCETAEEVMDKIRPAFARAFISGFRKRYGVPDPQDKQASCQDNGVLGKRKVPG
jgi:hypothetical protein